jgi:tetratricopeptide (TPR) repeat protein
MWKKAIAVWKDNKVLGVGTGNWKVVVQNYGNKDIVWGDGITVPDRTHNIYVEILAENGIVGFLLFISFWLLLGYLLLQICKPNFNNAQKIIAIVCFSFFAIYSTDGLFSFTNRHTDFQVLFYTSFGILCSQFQTNQIEFNFKKASIFTMCLLIFSFFAAKGAMYFLMKTKLIETYLTNRNSKLALEEVKNYKPTIFANLSDEGRNFEVFSSVVYDRLGMFDESITASKKIFKSNPNSFNGYINLGHIYYSKNMFDSALANYKKCLFLKPNYDLLKLNIARTFSKLNKCDSALVYLNNMEVSQFLDTEELKNNCILKK